MVRLDPANVDLSCLHRAGSGVTRRESSSLTGSGPFRELPGPILCDAGVHLDNGAVSIDACGTCARAVRHKTMPSRALANGLWLGDVPPCLKELNIVEKQAVARYRHNMCVVTVNRGQRRLSANAVVFAQPTEKFYHVLPPPPSDLGECLVLMFTGSATPTLDELKRTPLVFRRDVVLNALRWLKENHCDYRDLDISMTNLRSYRDNEPPVVIIHRPHSDDGPPAESLAAYEDGEDRGTAVGQCPLTVHGLTSSDCASLSHEAKLAIAMKHLRDGGGIIAYGQSATPESIYNNPRLYPGMFPWLYPYGLGGFGNEKRMKRLHHCEHVRWKLMYHDRRFQQDEFFIFVLFNQQQIRDASRGGLVVAQRDHFDAVAEKLMSIDVNALQSIIERDKDGRRVTANNDAEQACFDVIRMIDSVACHVDGSATKRKYMRNEIRSLMYQENVPMFFVTFAPVDFKHPVCLYFCGEKIQLDSFAPVLPEYQNRMRAIARNPVACARFFDLIVRLVLEHVLGYGKPAGGAFGPVKAYYGTVEAQGRLTLHLHMLIWIKESVSPQQIRDRIMQGDEVFKTEIKEWLEGCHQGEFCTGSLDDIQARIQQCRDSFPKAGDPGEPSDEAEDHSQCSGWRDPTTCLPQPPGDLTDDAHVDRWFDEVCRVTDEIVYLSNRHSPLHNKGCRRGPDGYCRVRFPRELHEETIFKSDTGAIRLKKGEEWINTFSVILSYLLRCNTDVSSLLSGTQVKAVLAYVTDYVTKHSLKTHLMFEVIKAVVDRKSEFLGDDIPAPERARKLLTKIVNALTAKLEIGGPMIGLFLLGLNDYYTSHRFKTFFWSSYRQEVDRAWPAYPSSTVDRSEKVLLTTADAGELVGYSPVHNYIHRPREFAQYCLYDYLRETDVRPMTKAEKRATPPARHTPPGVEDDGTDPVDGIDFEDDEDLPQEDDDDEQERPAATEGCLYRFLPQHPRYSTHGVVRTSGDHKWVLNFIGGALPRRDSSDREEYSRTMLTFFVPWRSGRELKLDDETWESAFERQYVCLQPHHKSVMDNFHVLFECHDARDDFASQRLQNAGRGQLDGIALAAEDLEDAVDRTEQSFMDDALFDFLFGGDDDLGSTSSARLRRMNDIRRILTDSGWASPRVFAAPTTDFVAGDGQTPGEWKQLVATAREK